LDGSLTMVLIGRVLGRAAICGTVMHILHHLQHITTC